MRGADVVTEVPDVGGGAWGAAPLAEIVQALQGRLEPGQGQRPGRPTDATWVHRAKIPMSEATARLAERASREGRKVSMMEMAAQLLRRPWRASRISRDRMLPDRFIGQSCFPALLLTLSASACWLAGRKQTAYSRSHHSSMTRISGGVWQIFRERPLRLSNC